MDRTSHRRRVNAGSGQGRYSVRGTAALKAGEYTGSVGDTADRRARAERPVSGTVRRNRAKALSMDMRFVIFLGFAVTLLVLVCVRYLNLKAQLSAMTSENETLASNLTTLQSENDALLESVTNSVDWYTIRDRAIHEFGMDYADEDQIVWYNGDNSSEVKQYADVAS